MKIGVYGGTFNPPHLGHAAAARAVVELLKLDRLLIIPAGLPPHKDLPAGSPTPEQRLEMTRLAADQLGLGDRVEVLDVEIHRHGKSYTADTLAALKARYPDDELWLLMGTDMFLTFQAWHEPERILSLAGIAAFGRTEADTEELFSVQRDYLYRTYPQARLFTLTIPGVVDISSTELREKLARGEGANFLPPAVYGYILREGLYNTQAEALGSVRVTVGVGDIGLDVIDGGAVHQVSPAHQQDGAHLRAHLDAFQLHAGKAQGVGPEKGGAIRNWNQ